MLLTESAFSLRHLIRQTSFFCTFLIFFFCLSRRKKKKKPLLECGAVAQDRYRVTLLAPWYMHIPYTRYTSICPIFSSMKEKVVLLDMIFEGVEIDCQLWPYEFPPPFSFRSSKILFLRSRITDISSRTIHAMRTNVSLLYLPSDSK